MMTLGQGAALFCALWATAALVWAVVFHRVNGKKYGLLAVPAGLLFGFPTALILTGLAFLVNFLVVIAR